MSRARIPRRIIDPRRRERRRNIDWRRVVRALGWIVILVTTWAGLYLARQEAISSVLDRWAVEHRPCHVGRGAHPQKNRLLHSG